MLKNYNSLIRQIEALSEEMMQDMSPIDWYRTLQQHQERNLKRIKEGITPPYFSAPLGVQLEITSKCNLTCVHCYNYSGKRKAPDGIKRIREEMSDEEWLKLAGELASLGIFECIISGGEPLLRKKLVFEILDTLSKHGVFFLLISNGWLMDEKVAENLSKYRFHYVQISIDGADAATHDSIRRRKGSWAKAVKAANFVKEAGLPLCIASTLMKQNWHQLSELIDLAAAVGAHQIIVDRFMSTGAAALNRNDLLLPDSWRKQYFETMLKKRGEYRGQMQILSSLDPVVQLRLDITGPTKVALVRPNGDVKLDCITPFVFGNIRQHPLKKIWEENMNTGWQKPEVIQFVETITKDEDLVYNGSFPIPHLQKNIDMAGYPAG